VGGQPSKGGRGGGRVENIEPLERMAKGSAMRRVRFQTPTLAPSTDLVLRVVAVSQGIITATLAPGP
jgi:hypothetical protein